MKVLVTGGRYFTDWSLVRDTLEGIHDKTPITLLIEGGATGADALAGDWAEMRGVPRQTFRADWDLHGKAAGPIRNSKMLKEKPDLVVAFKGGSGTSDMIRKAEVAGITVRRTW